MNSKPCFYVCSSFPVRATTVLYQLMTLMNNNRQETLKCVSLSRGWAEVVLSPMIPEGKTGGRKNTGTTNDLSLPLLAKSKWLAAHPFSIIYAAFLPFWCPGDVTMGGDLHTRAVLCVLRVFAGTARTS